MTLEQPSELKASQPKEHEMKDIAIPLRLELEVKTAIEAVTKMIDAESAALWGFSDIPLSKVTLNCVLQHYVLFGLFQTASKTKQKWQPQVTKKKE